MPSTRSGRRTAGGSRSKSRPGSGRGGARDSTGYELWLVRPDGSGLRSLDADANYCDSTNVVHFGNAWAWSPDSTKIVYTRKNAGPRCDPSPATINVLDLGTGHDRRLTTGSYPAWSPDGTQLAFVDRCRIWLMPTKGGKRTPLTYPRPRADIEDCVTDLGWSPDARWIAASTNASWFPLVTRPGGKRRYEAPFIRPAAVRWPKDCKRLFFYPFTNSYRVGWIVHGLQGLPRFARVPAPEYVGLELDWRC